MTKVHTLLRAHAQPTSCTAIVRKADPVRRKRNNHLTTSTRTRQGEGHDIRFMLLCIPIPRQPSFLYQCCRATHVESGGSARFMLGTEVQETDCRAGHHAPVQSRSQPLAAAQRFHSAALQMTRPRKHPSIWIGLPRLSLTTHALSGKSSLERGVLFGARAGAAGLSNE